MARLLLKSIVKDQGRMDPYTDHIIQRIDPKVRDSLSPAQRDAISEAIRTTGTETFPVDFRGYIPFFFARYYFIFLIGRDCTAAMRKTETFRRQRYSLMGGLLFALLVAFPFLLLLFTFLYLAKYFLGFDFIPEFHLYDIFR